MADTAQAILKMARLSHHLTQQQVAMMLSVSLEQYKRMEYGQVIPEMSDVDTLEEQLPEPGLFKRWARAQFPEIVKYFGDGDERDLGLLGSIVDMEFQMQDVINMQEAVKRDAVDGRIDDPVLRERYEKELIEARRALDVSIQKVREVQP